MSNEYVVESGPHTRSFDEHVTDHIDRATVPHA